MSVLRTTLMSRLVKVLVVCACLLGAGTHPRVRAQPPTQTLPPVSADTARGIELYKQGDIEEAIKLLKQASKQTPRDASAWHFLGLAYQQKGEQKNARKALETAVHLRLTQLNPRVLRVAPNLFPAPSKEEKDLYRAEQVRRYQAAREAIDAYLQLNPKDAAFWREQAESLQFYSAQTEQQDGAQALYHMAEVTTKAVILSKPLPRYTEEARRSRTGGRVALRLVLGADGTVQHILVVRALPDGLTEMAVAVAKQIAFQPATKDGRPVSQVVNVEYNFSIY